MSQDDPRSLADRLERLERTVAELTEAIRRLQGQAAEPKPTVEPRRPMQMSEVGQTASIRPAPPPPPPTAPAPPPRPRHEPFRLPEHMRRGEFWLSRVGIALLLFGVAFLFKYSIDQGWITPWLRTVFGVAVGAILLALGYRVHARRRTFANILLGGGLAVWYITGFAAYQILELVAYPVAMTFMVSVTVVAFVLALREDEAVLSVLAALGGFGTPFMLYSSSGNLPGLVLYTSLIIAGAMGVYFYKGWKALLWLSSACGWTVFLIGLVYNTAAGELSVGATGRGVTEGGVIFAWLGFWALPLVRELVWLRRPEQWARSSIGFADKSLSDRSRELLGRHLHAETVSAAIIGFGLSTMIWRHLGPTTWGWIALGVSVLYFGAAYLLRRVDQFRALAYTHLLVALTFFAVALASLLHGPVLLVAEATLAGILHLISRRLSDRVIGAAAHVVHLFIAYWMVYHLQQLLQEPSQAGFFTRQILADVWVVVTMIVAAAVTRSVTFRRVYGLFAAAALAIVLVHSISDNLVLFWLAAEIAALFGVAWVIEDRVLMSGAHFLFLAASLLLGAHLLKNRPDRIPILSLWAISEAWTIGLASLVAVLTERRIIRRLYVAAIIVATAGWLVAELGANLQLVALALEGWILVAAARGARDRVLAVYGHLFFAVLCGYLGWRMIDAFQHTTAIPLLNWQALTDVAAIIIVTLAGALALSSGERLTYRLVAHAAALGLLYSELLRLVDGQGWVSVSWGIYGIGLLVLGLRINAARLRVVALGTLMLLVVKLFLVDLDKLETVWRVLLFIGVGAAFLALSYYFRALWQTDNSRGAPPTRSG